MARTDWDLEKSVLPEDMNAIGEEINQLREDVDNIEIPPASLVEAGITKLNNSTNSTSQTEAATPKAVNDARQAAITAAETNAKNYADTGFIKKAILIPISANLNNYTSEGEFYCPANSTVSTLINCPVSDAFNLSIERHAGVVQTIKTFEPGNLQTYQRNYYNGTWGSWVKVPSRQEFDLVQKHKLTADIGISINVSNTNANALIKNGDYVGENISNAPRTGAAEWYYIRVSAMAAGVWVKQEAINLFTNTYQMRTGSDAGGGVISWGPWTQDVFQSGVNAKQAVVDAINAKGGSASTSDTWAQLAAKIQAIQQGIYQRIDTTLLSGSTTIPAGAGTFGPVIFTLPANTSVLSIQSDTSPLVINSTTSGWRKVAFVLVDIDGRMWPIAEAFVGTDDRSARLHSAQVDIRSGIAKSQRMSSSLTYTNYQSSKPSGFRSDAVMQLRGGVLDTDGGTQTHYYSWYPLTVVSM